MKKPQDIRERFPRLAELQAATADKIGAAMIDHIKHHKQQPFHPSVMQETLKGGISWVDLREGTDVQSGLRSL